MIGKKSSSHPFRQRIRCTGVLAPLAIAVLLGGICLAAELTTAPSLSKEVQLALTQLADDDPAVRQAAQDQLVQTGRDAIEPLRQLITTTADVEQRTGAQAALARILEQAAIGPTIITMKLDHATPAQIVAELAKQSGLTIKYEPNDPAGDKNKSLSINIDHQPFWSAMRQICTVIGVDIQASGRSDVLVLGPNGYDVTGPAVVDGPFMIVALSVNMSSNIQLNQPGNVNRNESIEFICFAEPKLQLSEHPYNVKLSDATDDTGKSLLLTNQEDMDDSYNNDSQAIWQAAANLVVPEPGAKKIKHLQGKVRLMAATKTETLEIPDILTAKNITRSAGGQSITVKDVTTNGDEIVVNATIIVPPNANNLGYTLAQNTRMLDANGVGVAIENSSPVGEGGNPNRLDFHLTFNMKVNGDNDKPAGKPAKLVLPVVLETKPIECEFEFKDLPLP